MHCPSLYSQQKTVVCGISFTYIICRYAHNKYTEDAIGMTTCCSPELLDQCQSFMEGEFFKAFTDDSRQRILLLLLENGEMTVNGVTARMQINQSNVSRHLALLRRAGVTLSERRGKKTYYKPNYENIAYRLDALVNVINQCCPSEEGEKDL